MKRLTLVLTLAALAGVCGNALAAGDAAAGKAKSATCVACHGADGNSANPEWPSIAGQHAPYLAKQLREFKDGTTRNNVLMTGIVAALDEQDMEDLAAYYASQVANPAVADADKVALGERIYRGGNAKTGVPACIACHGPQGIGDPLAGFPVLSGQHARYTSLQMHAFANGERSNDAASMMRSVAARMSAEEIEAVSAYVQGLH